MSENTDEPTTFDDERFAPYPPTVEGMEGLAAQQQPTESKKVLAAPQQKANESKEKPAPGVLIFWLLVVIGLFCWILAEVSGNQPLKPAFPDGYTTSSSCLAGQDVTTHQPINESETGGALISNVPGGTIAGGKVLGTFNTYENGHIVHLIVVGWSDTGSADPRLAHNPSPERQGRYWFYVFSPEDSRHGWVVDAGIDDSKTGGIVPRDLGCQLVKI